MKHIVCFSGGHSSALVAIECVRKFGKENVILVNHECKLEPNDVERFEREVANYLELPIIYVNFDGAKTKDQFDVCIEKGMFIYAHHSREMICTSIMKTIPFMNYLSLNFPPTDTLFYPKVPCTIYYGFDSSETARIQRRSTIMAALGYKTDYPVAFWNRTIISTEEIGIKPPNSYSVFKHANCRGCLKAGWQHWYCIYVLEPDIYDKGIESEETIGYTIHSDYSLLEKAEVFAKMVQCGIEPTERIPSKTFWALVNKALKQLDGSVVEVPVEESLPCECYL